MVKVIGGAIALTKAQRVIGCYERADEWIWISLAERRTGIPTKHLTTIMQTLRTAGVLVGQCASANSRHLHALSAECRIQYPHIRAWYIAEQRRARLIAAKSQTVSGHSMPAFLR